MKKDTNAYIHNHVQTIKERMDVVNQNLKWISQDIKVIEKFSKPKDEK